MGKSISDLSDLEAALQQGLSVVFPVWLYKTKDWVTSVYAADIDNDGDTEVIIGSRDGRVHVITNEGGCRWERIMGNKRAITSVLGIVPGEGEGPHVSVLVGTQDGKVYTLDRIGQTISKDHKMVYAFDQHGWAIEQDQEVEAFWHSSEYEIRYLSLDSKRSSLVVVDSEVCCVHTLDHMTGTAGWKFPTDGVVTAVFAADISGSGKVETLIASNNHLYVVDDKGERVRKPFDIQSQIHMIYCSDIDGDKQVEILLGTEGKVLSAYNLEGKRLWEHTFVNRFLAIGVADVDGDGQNEILVGSEDKHLYILDASTGKELWRHYLGYRIFSIYTCDIDHDDRIEVLVGTQDSKVYCWRIPLVKGLAERIRTLYIKSGKPSLATLEEKKFTLEQRTLLQHLISEIKPLTHPMTMELVMKQIKIEKYFEALLQTQHLKYHKVQRLWKKEQLGAVYAVDLADISHDGRREVVVAAKKSIYAFNTSARELWPPLQLDEPIQALLHGYLDPASNWSQVIAATEHRLIVISGIIRDEKKRTHAASNIKREVSFQERIKTLYINLYGKKNESFEIFVAFEGKKICVYKHDLQQVIYTIETPQEVRVLSTYLTNEKNVPALVMGSDGDVHHVVYAYGYQETKFMWRYSTKGRIEALCIKDIDGDKKLEIIVGSQDRNVHVIDQNGEWKWRYYLPDCVMAVDVYDVDGDHEMEILAGCSDGQLYVLSKDGDLRWTYQADGGILALQAENMDTNDEYVEIVICTENAVEVVRVVNQDQLQNLIALCWENLLAQNTSFHALIQKCLEHPSFLMRAFALRKIAEQEQHQEQDFELLERYIKDGSVEVRKALTHVLTSAYKVNPQRAQSLFTHISMDPERSVKLSLVKHIAEIMHSDTATNWDDGLLYLQRLVRNNDRFVRRAVMRELYTLVADFYHKEERERDVFTLLLVGLLEPEPSVEASEWVRQEAARTLAHFLDKNPQKLMKYLNLLIVKGVRREILQRVAYHAVVPFIKHIFQDLSLFIFEIDEDNVLEHLNIAIEALRGIALYGADDTLKIYKELQHLLTMNTIDDIAHYQCLLKDEAQPENVHFKVVLGLLHQLNFITRSLNTYLRRDDLKDRVNSLLEAKNYIEFTMKSATEEYTTKKLFGEPLSKLPDRLILDILLKRWDVLVTHELYRLSGSAKLVAEIQTNAGPFEEQMVVWLLLRNEGRVSANNVLVELLASEQFDVLGRGTFTTEAISAGDEMIAEFTIKPKTHTPNLTFEIIYADIEDSEKRMYIDGLLELYEPKRLFDTIPNTYSTGVPSTNMCYGRQDDLKFLSDNLTRSAATLLILYGQRRTGKTTLLFQLAHTQVLHPHIPLLIDMQDMVYDIRENTFFYTLASRIAQVLEKRGIAIPLEKPEEFLQVPTFVLNRFLDKVEIELKEQKLIILIDEFDVLERQVENKKLAPEVFDYLRSLVQYRQKLTFLFSGVHNIDQLTGDYWTRFFNIANHYRLSKLSEQGAISLITMPVKGFLEYEPYAIKKIRQLTADQPYLIHVICRPLVDYCNMHEKTYVTLNDVNTVLKEVVANGSHFKWIWIESTSEERFVLAVLAEVGRDEGRSLSLVEIEEQFASHSISYKREQILSALQNLIGRDIVALFTHNTQVQNSDEEQYRISVGLIRNWLRITKKVKRVLREENMTMPDVI